MKWTQWLTIIDKVLSMIFSLSELCTQFKLFLSFSLYSAFMIMCILFYIYIKGISHLVSHSIPASLAYGILLNLRINQYLWWARVKIFYPGWVRSGQPSLVWVWVWKISPKNPTFFNFLPFRSKRISSGWIKKYPDQSASYLLQFKSMLGLGQGPSLTSMNGWPPSPHSWSENSLYEEVPFYQWTVPHWFFSWLRRSSLGLHLFSHALFRPHHQTC